MNQLNQATSVQPAKSGPHHPTVRTASTVSRSFPVVNRTLTAIGNLALDILTENLQEFGNVLSNQRREELHHFLWSLAVKALNPTGITVYPLPCGNGKTQAIVALCTAIYRLGFHDVSLLIAAFKVEALCELKRCLIQNGVPESRIGLRHSYKCASEASTDENGHRQFLLTTQFRAKNVKNGDLDYQGQPRHLLIWDESLLTSDPFSIRHVDIKSSVGYIAPRIGEETEVIHYLNRCLEMLETEVKRQKDGESPRLIWLPKLPEEKRNAFQNQIKDEMHGECLTKLLDQLQTPLRVVVAGNEAGVIGYRTDLNVGIDSIAILDASYPLRLLEQMDNSIRPPLFAVNTKRHDRVTIHHLDAPSGRRSIIKNFNHRRRDNRTISLEICEVVANQIPQDEGVIVFNFKQRPGESDVQEILREDLRHYGLDLDATVNVKIWQDGQWVEQEKPRFVWLTWGQETSLSAYAYCKHVIFVGVLQRSHIDVAAAIAGQKNNLLAELSLDQLRRAVISEAAHTVYQGMHRGACRVTEGDQAQEMHAWLIYPRNKDFIGFVDKAMPGVQWQPWLPEYPATQQGQTAAKIKKYLNQLQVDRISVQALKKQAGLQSIHPKTFTRSLEQALVGAGWKKNNRTLVRVPGGPV